MVCEETFRLESLLLKEGVLSLPLVLFRVSRGFGLGHHLGFRGTKLLGDPEDPAAAFLPPVQVDRWLDHRGADYGSLAVDCRHLMDQFSPERGD